MNKTAVGVGLLVLLAGGAGFYAQSRAYRVLRSEIAGLREDVRLGSTPAKIAASAPLPNATTASTKDSSDSMPGAGELVKLREEIAALRKSTQALTQFAQAAQAAAALKNLAASESSVATKLTPSEALRNAGRSSPEAATETVLWAAFAGEVDTLSEALVLTPTAREKADAWFAGLSESTRQQYGSPEKVMALMIAKDAAGLSGMQVLGRKEVSPDNVGVRVRFASSDGKSKDDSLLMRRVNDGWRMVLPDSAVEKFARQLSGLK